jgi:hypothetical protein
MDIWDEAVAALRDHPYDEATGSFKGSGPSRLTRLRYVRVPWPWVMMTAHLPGKAVVVALLIQLQVSLRRSSTVTLDSAVLELCGVRRMAAARALRCLETAGLIRVGRAPGRKLRITVVDGPAPPKRQQPLLKLVSDRTGKA